VIGRLLYSAAHALRLSAVLEVAVIADRSAQCPTRRDDAAKPKSANGASSRGRGIRVRRIFISLPRATEQPRRPTRTTECAEVTVLVSS